MRITILYFISFIVIAVSCLNSKHDNIISEEDIAIDYETMLDSIVDHPSPNTHCLECHQGIMPTRSPLSPMMKQIFARGEKLGDPNGCVVCHGGDPTERTDKVKAHSGAPEDNELSFFTSTPAAMQLNNNTCGLCHEDHVYNMRRSNMNTDAGKAKYLMWSWGIDTENKDHTYGNYALDDPDGSKPRFGTESYKEYMLELASLHPGQFPSELKAIPEVDPDSLSQMPEQAVFTLLRNCNACHVSNSSAGNRGLGCAACHSLYSNSRRYEGKDSTLQSTGRMMAHGMMGSRKSRILINGVELSGVQTSTCSSCHTSGKRIGSTFQGFMGRYLQDDAHHRIKNEDGKTLTGLLCQDCHTSTAMHGNGNIGTTTLASVEIECADCHGTPTHYPWELPLAYGEEFGRDLTTRPERGVSETPSPETTRYGTTYNARMGLLLSSRGNPLGNVIRTAESEVTLHSATGNSFKIPQLKQLTDDKAFRNQVDAETAMVAVAQHMESLECYACHSAWAGQYYGNTYTIDYRYESTDYVSSTILDSISGTTDENKGNYHSQRGQRRNSSYAHSGWQTPPLGINGEGRVAPMTAIIQTVGSVIDQNGDTLLWQHAPTRSTGEHAMELTPLHPHTNSREARKCQECHGNDLAMGYGADGGRFSIDPSIDRYMDVVDAEGNPVSKYTKPQIAAVKSLNGAFDQIFTRDGRQRLSVGSHWEGESPLTTEQLYKLSRSGTCAACHQSVPSGTIPISMLKEIAQVANLSFDSEEEHSTLLMQNNILMAWIKVIGIVMFPVLFLAVVWYLRHRNARKKNDASL